MPVHHPHHRVKKNNPDYFDSAMSFVAVLSPLSMTPQIYQIYQYKNADGVSLATWIISIATSLIWLLYGLHHKDKPIIFNSTMGVVLCSAIATGVFLYK